MPETFLDGKVTLLRGDCLERLREFEECSVDSCVTDPPYGLQFMGREWDKLWRNDTKADQAYVERTKGQLTSRARKLPDYSATKPAQMQNFHLSWAELVLRVLKPGAHLLAFSSTRTYHRMACAIEDAGFEIRDQIGWCYGSGFPKSHNIGLAIDRLNGAPPRGKAFNMKGRGDRAEELDTNGREFLPPYEANNEWGGWGTALKPAWEPIVLARKPLSESSIAQNVLEWGTGAINIDQCRIEAESNRAWRQPSGNGVALSGSVDGTLRNEIEDRSTLGRWPANLIHDGSEEVLAGFPETQSGVPGIKRSGNSGVYGADSRPPGTQMGGFGDEGSAARFFYSAKADADDRLGSKHPTVKPLDLIQYLVRLVTPNGGTVLDPFAGTGTTGEAAWREGFRACLVEREAEYQADIVKRMGLCLAGPDERRAATVAQLPPSDLPMFAGLES